MVARFDESGNMKYGEYTYKKLIEDTGTGNVSDKRIPLHKKEQGIPVVKIDEPKTQGVFFTGTKSFCSQEYEDDCIEITIKENGAVTFSDPTDAASKLTTGHIQGVTIVDANGKDLFIKYKPYHLFMKRGNKWIDFNELETQ